jgi:acetyl esterase/lipase
MTGGVLSSLRIMPTVNILLPRFLALAFLCGCLAQAFAAKDPALVRRAAERAAASPSTFVDVHYGPHPSQTMDVWLARSNKSAPLVFYIHGGGWMAQDKSDIHEFLDVGAFLKAGVSVASINYRFLSDANAAGVKPLIKWPLEDAACALQFVRTKAAEWHIDKTRIAATGVSAGGGSSLWLAFHEDMADPKSTDPVAHESTRVCGVAGIAPVVCLDPKLLREWIPNAIFGAHAFGYLNLSRKDSFEPFLAARESYLPDVRRYSPLELVNKNAPPVFIDFPNQDKAPVKGDPQTDPNHSALSGVMLQEKMKALGMSMELRYKGDGKTGHADAQDFLMDLLSGSNR